MRRSAAGRSGRTPRARARSASDRAAGCGAPDAGSTRCSIRCRNVTPRRVGDALEPRAAAPRRGRAPETARASGRDSRSRCRRRRSAAARAPESPGWPRPHRAHTAPRCTPRSDRRCRSGDAGCRAARPSGTLSVPMSKPRYTAVESQLMISPPIALGQRQRQRALARRRSGRARRRPTGSATDARRRRTTTNRRAGESAGRAAAGSGHQLRRTLRCRRT